MNLNINLSQQQLSTLAKKLNISEEELKKQAQAKENPEEETVVAPGSVGVNDTEGSLQALDSMALMNAMLVNNKAKEDADSKTYTFTSSSKTQTIVVNGESFSVTASVSGKNEIKVVVGKDGKINIYNNGGTNITFTSGKKDLNINVEKSTANLSIFTGGGNDLITVQEGAKINVINSGAGDDVIVNNGANNSNAKFIGNAGNDMIFNNAKIKSIDGSSGNDDIFNLEKGNVESLLGNAGNDNILNLGNVNTIDGGANNDRLDNFGTATTINGGIGTDTVGAKNGATVSGVEKYDDGIQADGKYYVNGVLANGVYNNCTYENGKIIKVEIGNILITCEEIQQNQNGTFTVSGKATRGSHEAEDFSLNVSIDGNKVIVTFANGETIEFDSSKSSNGVKIGVNYGIEEYSFIDEQNHSVVRYNVFGEEESGIADMLDLILHTQCPNFSLRDYGQIKAQYINGEMSLDNLNTIVSAAKNGNSSAFENLISQLPQNVQVACHNFYNEFKSQIGNENISSYSEYINKLNTVNPELFNYFTAIDKLFFYNYLDINVADLSDTVKSDIDMLWEAHTEALKVNDKGTVEYQKAFDDYVSSKMVKNYLNSDKSLEEIASETQVGEVIETANGLYVNDGTGLKQLNMTKEQYIELFPPVERYATNQGGTGDCYFIADVLVSWMNNPNTFSRILQMIDVDSETGDVTITFDGLPEYSVIFEKGKLKDFDGDLSGQYSGVNIATSGVNGCLGCQMLEQAYAIVRFADERNHEISTIDIDAAMSYIWGGVSYYNSRVLFGENIVNQKHSKIYILNAFEKFKQEFDALGENVINYIEAKEEYNPIFEELNKYLEDNKISSLEWYNKKDKFKINLDTKKQLLDIIDKSVWEVAVQYDDMSLIKTAITGTIYSELIPFLISYSQVADLAKIIIKLPDNCIEIKNNYYDSLEHINLQYDTNIRRDQQMNVAYEKILNCLNIDDVKNIEELGLSQVILNYLENDETYLITYKEIDIIAEQLSNHEISIYTAFDENFNDWIVSNHAYSVSNIDPENKTVSIINPWAGGVEIILSYDEFLEIANAIQITPTTPTTFTDTEIV